ncbi:unnamed protein product [Closterium sp. NIES-64]|nr:unnamed protein product [Closterium sp. NIES-64]
MDSTKPKRESWADSAEEEELELKEAELKAAAAAAAAEVAAKAAKDADDAEDAPPGLTPRSAAKNTEFGESAEKAAADLDSLKVSEGVVDQPDLSIKTGELNDVPDGSEHEIKKVVAAETPYSSAKTFEELNLSEPLLRGPYLKMMNLQLNLSKALLHCLTTPHPSIPHPISLFLVLSHQVVAAETPYSSAKTFEELNLSEPLLRGLYSEMKFERPSKIQAVTLPMILQPPNANLIAQPSSRAISPLLRFQSAAPSEIHAVTLCPLSAHSLPTLCPLSAHSLPTVCPLSAHSLPTLCPLSAHSLPTVSAPFPPLSLSPRPHRFNLMKAIQHASCWHAVASGPAGKTTCFVLGGLSRMDEGLNSLPPLPVPTTYSRPSGAQRAHNGSGKTTCFVLGMLSRVDPQIKAPQALCICPTRELAQQVRGEVEGGLRRGGCEVWCEGWVGNGCPGESVAGQGPAGSVHLPDTRAGAAGERQGEEGGGVTVGRSAWQGKKAERRESSISVTFETSQKAERRESSISNEAVLLRMAKYTGITCACTASEGTGTIISSSQQERLGDQVVIGTPGTLKRWMTKDRILPVKSIKILVFDEADHMLDQRVVPSANQVYVPKEQLSLDVIKQYRVRVPSRDAKVVVLKDKIFPAAEKLGQKLEADGHRCTSIQGGMKLEADGHRCTSIQGGMSHEERDDVIREFRSGTTKILIATDVLARGFDQAQVRAGGSEMAGEGVETAQVRAGRRRGYAPGAAQVGRKGVHAQVMHLMSLLGAFCSGTTKIRIATDVFARGFDQVQVTLVVNFDLPVKNAPPNEPEYETYLHRIGRSGRFGRKGAAFNLVCGEKDERTLNKIEKHFDRVIPDVQWDDEDAFEKVLKEAGLA